MEAERNRFAIRRIARSLSTMGYVRGQQDFADNWLRWPEWHEEVQEIPIEPVQHLCAALKLHHIALEGQVQHARDEDIAWRARNCLREVAHLLNMADSHFRDPPDWHKMFVELDPEDLD